MVAEKRKRTPRAGHTLSDHELAAKKRSRTNKGLESKTYVDNRRQVTLSAWVTKTATSQTSQPDMGGTYTEIETARPGHGQLSERRAPSPPLNTSSSQVSIEAIEVTEAKAEPSESVYEQGTRVFGSSDVLRDPADTVQDRADSTGLTEELSAGQAAMLAHTSSSPPMSYTWKKSTDVDIWIGDDDAILMVEDTTTSGDIVRTWSGNDDSTILLDEDQYIQSTDSVVKIVEAIAADDGGCDASAHPEELVHVLRSAEMAFGSKWPEVHRFLSAIEEQVDEDKFRMQFEAFRKAESALSTWDSAHIVKPSGSPNSPLHVKLNYRTFKSQKLEYGETADDTNVCTKLLLKKGLSLESTFWFEACFRRQTPPTVRHQATATKFWPTDVRELHTSFSHRCEALPKKVLLVFGAPNRKDFQARYEVSEFIVSVSESVQVPVGIVHDSNGIILFLVVYCPHPEWLFHNWAAWASQYFDACVNIAAALAKVTVNSNYFRYRSETLTWRVRNDTPARDAQTALYLEKVNGVLCRPDELPQSLKVFVEQRSIDLNELETEHRAGRSAVLFVYKILKQFQPEIKTLRKQRLDKELFMKRLEWFSNLPEDAYGANSRAIVLAAHDDDALPAGEILNRPTMFTDNLHTYFYRPTRSTHAVVLSDSTPSIVASSSLETSPKPPSASYISQTLLPSGSTSTMRPNEIPTDSKSKNPLINTAVIRLGQPIRLKCIKCGKPPHAKPVNDRPEFCTIAHVAGRYIARAQVCASSSCQNDWKKEKGRSGRRMMMVPEDVSIPYIRSDQLNELNY